MSQPTTTTTTADIQLFGYSFDQLLYALESYGIDLTAMLVLFLAVVALISIFSIKLYLNVVARQNRIDSKNLDDPNKSNQNGTATQVEERVSQTNRKADHLEISNQDSTNVSDFSKWIDQVIKWFDDQSYQRSNQSVIGKEFIKNWLDTLNFKSRRLIFENGLFIEFVELCVDQSAKPTLVQTNEPEVISSSIASGLRFTSDCLVFKIRAAYNSADVDTNNCCQYLVKLEKFSWMLKANYLPNECLLIMRPLERPETKVMVDGPFPGSIDNIKISPDLLINAVLNVLIAGIVDFDFSKLNDLPKFPQSQFSPFIDQQTSGSSTEDNKQLQIVSKVLVKVVRANNLNTNHLTEEDHQLCCVVSVDEPAGQLRRTVTVKNDDTAVWEQHFILNLDDNSRQFLFEVFANDSSTNSTKIGQTIVNVSDLKLNPSQELKLKLDGQSGQEVGTLDVQFLLMEHSLMAPATPNTRNEEQEIFDVLTSRLDKAMQEDKDLAQRQQEEWQHSSTPKKKLSLTSSNDPIESNDNSNGRNSLAVDDSTIDDCQISIIGGYRPVGLSSFELDQNSDHHHHVDPEIFSICEQLDDTSSLSMFLEQQEKVAPLVNYQSLVENDSTIDEIENSIITDLKLDDNNNSIIYEHRTINEDDGKVRNIDTITNDKHLDDNRIDDDQLYSELTKNTASSHNESLKSESEIRNHGNEFLDSFEPSVSRNSQTMDRPPRGPSREPKFKIMKSLKKRFSFNKRSKSVDRKINENNQYKSIDEEENSMTDDHSSVNRNSRSRSVPVSRQPSQRRDNYFAGNVDSYGNLSQVSTRTFMHDDSVLIIEMASRDNNKDIRHYIVSKLELKRFKFLKNGVKLHHYKNHLFQAQHIDSNSKCSVCDKKFRWLGKQAYQCRDCKVLCHKPCHVLVANLCPSSSISKLNWKSLYVDDQYNYGTPSPPISTVPEVFVTDVTETNNTNNTNTNMTVMNGI